MKMSRSIRVIVTGWVLLMVFSSVLAGTAVRDHRSTPVIRDYRGQSVGAQPVARDHRSSGIFIRNRNRCRPPVDTDWDCLLDRDEDELVRRFAPEVRLAPVSKDRNRPANVDWYLRRVHMRFDHKSCKDHQILGRGKVLQANIHRQSHKLNKSLCRHKDKRVYSRSADKRFFLQPPDNRVHLGARASQWKAYAHAKPSTFFKGGVDIQYWFFYPFNNSPDPRVAMGTFNHEGDWELVTVTLDAGLQFHSALYAAHNGGKRFYPYKGKRRIRFVGMTHAIVYSAAGSHASYPAAGTWPFDFKGTLKDHVYEGGPRWQTWKSVVNVGERSYPMNNQTFIQYGGRWGEVGSRALRAVGIEDTSGPMGPAFQKSWSR